MVLWKKNILPVIESVYGSLTHLEKERLQIIFCLMRHLTANLSAQALCLKLYVSVPSLTRFAKKCGFSGYRQFIFEFQESSSESKNVSRDLTRNVAI